MTPTDLPNKPALAGDYDLGDGRYCRVTVTKTGSAHGHVHYEAQGWQLNADGSFVIDDSGWPVRTPGSVHGLNLSGVVAKTATLHPGWVKHVPKAGSSIDPAALPEGWSAAESLPATGAVGDQVWVGDQGWEWSIGELERIRAGKAEDMAQIIAERDMAALVGG